MDSTAVVTNSDPLFGNTLNDSDVMQVVGIIFGLIANFERYVVRRFLLTISLTIVAIKPNRFPWHDIYMVPLVDPPRISDAIAHKVSIAHVFDSNTGARSCRPMNLALCALKLRCAGLARALLRHLSAPVRGT